MAESHHPWFARMAQKLRRNSSADGESSNSQVKQVPRKLQKRSTNSSATSQGTLSPTSSRTSAVTTSSRSTAPSFRSSAATSTRTLAPSETSDLRQGLNELGERNYNHPLFSETSTLVGIRRDHTDMIHGLSTYGSFDTLTNAHGTPASEYDPLADRRDSFISRDEKHEQMVANLPDHIWQQIASNLNPADVARLSLTTKTLQKKIGGEPLRDLALPQNHHHLNSFLSDLDRYYPNHLHCFPCAKYHRRIRMGHERLKTDFVANPLYVCPKVFSSYLPRIRLVHGHELPYSFIQLAVRYQIYSKKYGIDPELLCQRWRDPSSDWTHTTRYTVHDGHLLVRVRSQVFAGAKLTETAKRRLLFDARDDYLPYFSVCAHWRDGELTRILKCALSHIPEPPQSYFQQLKSHPVVSRSLAHPNFLAVMCDECRPARRCPECPTEYLVEVKLTEDKHDAVDPFKHALVVTRWSDLGDGSGPTASPEYCAVQGIKADYDSFSHVGRRVTAGIFESKMNNAIPGQRMISLNPRNRKLGEDGHGWY